jgi:hypothetical protein
MSELEWINVGAGAASVGSFAYIIYEFFLKKEWKQIALLSVFALLLAGTVYLSTELSRERQIETEATAIVAGLPSAEGVIWNLPGSNCSFVARVLALMDKYKLENSILRSRAKVCERELTGDRASDATYNEQTKDVALLAVGLVRLWAGLPAR